MKITKRFLAACAALIVLVACISGSVVQASATAPAAPGKPTATTKIRGVNFHSGFLFSYYECFDKTITFKWDKVSGADGYEVSYKVNSCSPVIVSVKTTKYELGVRTPFQLPIGGKVKVMVRAYSIENGVKVYSAWSKARTVYY